MHRHKKNNQTGFTIVELLIVIVVIGILAAITIVAFRGIQERAAFAKVNSDLRGINTALKLYYADNGAYPYTGTIGTPTWRYSCNSISAFIPELSIVVGSIMQAPCKVADKQSDTWLYASNGAGYKLIHIRPGFTDDAKANIPVALRDSRWASNGSWGYWTDDWSAK